MTKSKITPYKNPLCFWNAMQGTHCVWIPESKYYTTSDLLGPRQIQIMQNKGPTVFWKRDTRNPLHLDRIIQNIILPQIGLAQNKIKNNAIQGDNCVLETSYRETIMFGSHDRGPMDRPSYRFGIMQPTLLFRKYI